MLFRSVVLPRYITGKVDIGEILGYVSFTVNGEEAGSVPLVATEAVSAAKQSVIERIKNFIFG